MTDAPRFLDHTNDPLPIEAATADNRFPRVHVFERDDIDAINAALAAGRPLLLRGRPGTGKSQLAWAAAVALRRAFVAEVIDARTESRDLLWRFDAVRRLADAQVGTSKRLEKRAGDLEREALARGDDPGEVDVLHERFYTAPGPLWWAFDWASAARHAAWSETGMARQPLPACDPENGVVVLLDEIDKADSSVPNGLLGALGDRAFTVPGCGEIKASGTAPLVVVTTNEERSLPDAFLRRCAVHHLDRDQDEAKLRDWLHRLGEAHFGAHIAAEDREKAAQMVLDDRRDCIAADLSPPGGAEYLDLLRAAAERGDTKKQRGEYLEIARRFLVKKHPDDTPADTRPRADQDPAIRAR